MVAKFQPDMNCYVTLPKDFKKSNPKAKKANYPALTGYTALHFGKFFDQFITLNVSNRFTFQNSCRDAMY